MTTKQETFGDRLRTDREAAGLSRYAHVGDEQKKAAAL
jgi:hypothetical protein